MQLTELVEPQELNINVRYHDQLNQDIFDDYNLDYAVRDRLLLIADYFIEFLKVPELPVTDIVITGSMANFNWTTMSDIDLHIMIDMDPIRESCPGMYEEYFQAKKKIWNDTRNITIYGYEVELYAQDKDEPHIATGMYSVLHNTWVIEPSYDPPSIDEPSVKAKAAQYMNLIDHYTNEGCDNIDELDKVKAKIRKMRQSGLHTAGEFSVENLAFKVLRNKGYLAKLSDCYENARDQSLSLN